MRRSRAASRSTLVALGASGALGLAMLPSSSALAVPVGGGAVDFAATGATQTYTVPASVCEVTISVEGAQGGHGALHSGNSGVTATGGGGGVGGNGTATVVVQPGQVLSVDVGVAGGDGTVNFGGGTQAAGGFGGGANAGVTYKSVGAGGGGGATSVRIGDTPLVIAGGAGWQNEREMERIKDPRFSNYRLVDATISKFERVRRIPYLPLDQLVTLMRGARALLFPSVFEGFGLPVLEAMSLGTPVMTSNTTSLPEIAGDAALLVDPHDVGSMVTAIRQLDNDTDLLDELSGRGVRQAALFSMAAYQQRIAALYGRVLGG